MTKYRLAGLMLGIILALPLAGQQNNYNQADFLLSEDDIRILKSSQGEGYELFIRKKPMIESVQLFLSERETAFAILTEDAALAAAGILPQYNSAYGGRAWMFVSSLAEYTKALGQAFHFYLPREVYVQFDPPEGPLSGIAVDEGFVFLIRAFSIRYANSRAFFQDSPSTLRLNQEERNPAPKAAAGSKLSFHNSFVFRPGVSIFNPGTEGMLAENELKLLTRNELVGALSISQDFYNSIGYELSVDRDSLLLNRIILRGRIKFSTFVLEAGPFLGALNLDWDRLNPGLSALFKAALPSYIFSGYVRVDTSLGKQGKSLNDGDHLQELQEYHLLYSAKPFSLGFTLTNREFSRRIEDAVINSGWIRYNISGGYSSYAYNFSIGLNLGYQDLRWTYRAAGRDINYHYFNIYTGLEWILNILPNLELLLYLEAPLYPSDYVLDARNAFLVNANFGIRWSF